VQLRQEEGSNHSNHLVHLPYPGNLMGVLMKNAECRLSEQTHSDKEPKFSLKLEAVKIEGVWIGINSILSNQVVKQMLIEKMFPFNQENEQIVPEFSMPPNRFDFVIKRNNVIEEICEVKTVSVSSDWFRIENTFASASNRQNFPSTFYPYECNLKRTALFPDGYDGGRAKRHLTSLVNIQNSSEIQKSHLIYFVPREDVENVSCSWFSDKEYAKAYKQSIGKLQIYEVHVKMDVEDPQKAMMQLRFIKNS
jgi:DNA-binding sugar fermentation-stimulating protein